MVSGTTSAVSVPFMDLSPAHAQLAPELLGELSELIDSGQFVNGPQVASFEEAFAAWCRVRHCVGASSGLDALRLGLLAAGLEPGDEVVMPALTFVATAEAVSQAGGRPVLADISDDDWNLDPRAAETAATSATRFLLPVHLYGQLADMGSFAKAARRLGVDVVEDACQAHGAERDGVRAGWAGRFAAFSFYPAKNLGAMGDAGALVTSDPGVADATRSLREHGQRRKYHHDREGWTARLDTIQALVLLRKLELVDGWNEERRAVAASYTQALEGVGDLRLPPVPPGSSPVWHLYVVRTGDPDALAAFLESRAISTARHYPVPVHLTDAYAHLGYSEGAFPVAEALARECLSLPIFPGITEAQVSAVVDGVREYFGDRAA